MLKKQTSAMQIEDKNAGRARAYDIGQAEARFYFGRTLRHACLSG